MVNGAVVQDYVKAGFALVPIPLGQKNPIRSGWNERENAITTVAAAAKITGNVGIAHAYCTPAPTVALDIDDYQLSIKWFTERGVDLAAIAKADDSVLIQSGRSNRTKLLFRLPENVGPLSSVQYVDSVLTSIVFEFRCASKNGKTVQDVLPPSIHPDTGKPYEWAGKGHFSNLPFIPQSLLTIWKDLLSNNQRRSGNSNTGESLVIPGIAGQKLREIDSTTRVLIMQPETPRQIANVRDMLSYISADCSYDTYRDIIWAVADTSWHCAYDLVLEWSLTAPHRFEEEALKKTFNGFNNSAGIHFGTLIHLARLGGWNG